MNTNTENKHLFDRRTIISLLTNAIEVKSFRFARRLAEAWLEIYSGDIVIESLLAQASLKEERIEEAVPLIKKIVFTDPEYLPAQRLLAYSTSLTAYSSVETARECILALGGRVPESNLPGWSSPLKRALQCQKEGKREQAELAFQHTLAQQPDSPLAHVLHLKFLLESKDQALILSKAKAYSQRWPDTLACILIYSDALTRSGEEAEGINLLHHAVSLDIGGQVAGRLWGGSHPYINLWPTNPSIDLQLPIPADVATAVGWNQLPAGAPIRKPSQRASRLRRTRHNGRSQQEVADSKKVVSKARQELEELAIQIENPVLGAADARFPAYIILTAKNKLEAQYGTENLNQICQTIELVEKNTKQIKGWNAYTIYVDDPMCADDFSLPPALADDPWSIKTFIQDLDISLAEKGERIGAILIVGGDKIIPFHLLPNPIEDFDVNVPSDNPYACDDENYFIPQWPLGRLPGSAGSDPTALLNQLKSIINSREIQTIQPRPSVLRRLFRWMFNTILPKGIKPNYGYTAEVWRRASHAVYRPIGKPHHLKVSPPVTASRISAVTNHPSHLAYFNLHGLEDAAEWYGQKDPVENQSGPDYPVALRPVDIRNSGAAPKIIFSEACFGANVLNKTVEDAICLKFLDSGTQALVGSSCTSYGSITTPLIAADLLGKTFWSLTQDGYPVGEALRRAKIYLAREMNQRQGYLDGEDQKTLISFILYGDPLAHAFSGKLNPDAKFSLQPDFNPDRIKMVSDKANLVDNSQVPVEIIKQVKGIVENYLPGMEGAKFSFSEGQAPIPANSKFSPTRKVVTLSKQIVKDEKSHTQHARITLNAEGKMTKLVVSR